MFDGLARLFRADPQSIAASLRANSTPTAPPACNGCMRGVSADFDLSHAFNKTLVRGRRFDKQLHLRCASAETSHEFMNHKLLAQGLLERLGYTAPGANIYGAFADWPVAESWLGKFRGTELASTLRSSGARSWVLKGAFNHALVMTPWRWRCEKWTEERVVTEAARILRNTTEQPRCPTREGAPGGGARRAILVQRTYPTWFLRATESAAIDCSAPPPRDSSVFWLELKINVVWGQLGRGLVLVHQGLQDAASARVGVYFDEKGVLTLVDGTAKLPPSDTLQRAISVLRRTAPKLQEIVLDVSRLFGADYWRLDAFVSDGAPLHINELTYPSFYMSRSSLDMARLKSGYEQVAVGAIAPLSGACVLKQLERLAPGSLRDEAAAATAKDRACAPYMRQFAGAGGGEGKYRYRRGKAKGGGCDCMHKCVQACPLGLSTKLCDHMCTPQCSRHCGEEPFGH